jgi:hypothetical protein
MNRRDFLLFRTDEPHGMADARQPVAHKVLELSCERLYMQYLDAQLTPGSCAEPGSEESESGGFEEFWGGEPPALFEPRAADQFLGAIEVSLASVDTVRVMEPQWLSDDLGRRIERLLESFRARGGKVEFLRTRQRADDPSNTTR